MKEALKSHPILIRITVQPLLREHDGTYSFGERKVFMT
jgi:hypothetical protein